MARRNGTRLMYYFIASVFITGSFFNYSQAQEINYRELFKDDWKKAEEFIDSNSGWIKPFLRKNDIGFNEAMAVVFPELIRYSALRDRMETALLKTLYVNLGKEYANFSIGPFQMKPSFAELLGISARSVQRGKLRQMVRDSAEFSDITDYRKAILTDLEDPSRQLGYLVVFFRICERKFNLTGMNPEERIRFLSTAYNYGFFRQQSEIAAMEGKRFFSNALFSGDHYPYADVSLAWYRAAIKKR